jgi:catechol 2,3-dioxygenase-like lactoylglutathione lyase family enzyme
VAACCALGHAAGCSDSGARASMNTNMNTAESGAVGRAGSGSAAVPMATQPLPQPEPPSRPPKVEPTPMPPRSPEDSGVPVTSDEAASLRPLCSGCPDEQPDKRDMTIHLHHIHLNVSDREASERFYEKFFATERIRLNEVTDALYAAPVLLLLDESQQAPIGSLPTALQHLSWGSADVVAWYNEARAAGIEPDTRGGTLFNTLDTPTIGEPGGGDVIPADDPCLPRQNQYSYIYVLGPDDERIEVWTGADKRINHIHFTTANLRTTARWYRQFLNLTANDIPIPEFFAFPLDDILFFIEPIGRAADYEPTDNHTIGHIAFSVTDLEAWLQRATDQAIEIVSPPAEVHGFTSFFVRGPDGMLIELVQAAPLADLCPLADR